MVIHAKPTILKLRKGEYTAGGSLTGTETWGDKNQESLTRLNRDIDERISGGSVGDPTLSDWAVSRRYDSNSNLVALGGGIDFRVEDDVPAPGDFCTDVSGAVDPRCTELSRDLLGRLVRANWSGSSSDLLGYDAHGNISVVAQGCAAGTAPVVTPTVASANGVSFGPSCGVRREYVWDDFGRLVLYRAPVGNGYADTRYEYDPSGRLVLKETQTQRAAGEVLTIVRDGLGRQTSVDSTSTGAVTTLSSQTWDIAPAVPSSCAGSIPARAAEHIAYSEDPVWSTWFAYDLAGR